MRSLTTTNQASQTNWAPGDAERYSECIRHETIRVAVCDQVEAALKESPDCPAIFREQILKSFSESYDKYEEIVKGKLHLTGTTANTFGFTNMKYQYETLLTRMRDLREQVKQKSEAAAAAAAEAATSAADAADATAAIN
ncbi:hypothetical protein MTO96_000607 [Rhipicephalus appendiculatus]